MISTGDPDREVSSAPPPRSILHRLAPLMLVGGAVAATVVFIPHLPRERHVDFRLDDSTTIVAIDVDWSASDRSTSTSSSLSEPLQGGSWRFRAGTAPSMIPATVRLPDGAYDIEILIERTDRTESVHRLITLGDADRITVPIR